MEIFARCREGFAEGWEGPRAARETFPAAGKTIRGLGKLSVAAGYFRGSGSESFGDGEKLDELLSSEQPNRLSGEFRVPKTAAERGGEPDQPHPLTVTEPYTGTPTSRTTIYTYDANGNRTTLTDPAGALTRYTYDGLNRLVAVATGTGVAIYDYYLDSRRKKVSYPNASFETVTYDAAARVQSVENRQSLLWVCKRSERV